MPPPIQTQEKRDRAYALWKEGKTLREIAQELQISHQRVHEYLLRIPEYRQAQKKNHHQIMVTVEDLKWLERQPEGMHQALANAIALLKQQKSIS